MRGDERRDKENRGDEKRGKLRRVEEGVRKENRRG